MERRTREFVGGTMQALEFRGFRLEHERGSEDMFLCNAQNQTVKLAMPIETFLLLCEQVNAAGWLPKRGFRDATTPAAPALQNTGS